MLIETLARIATRGIESPNTPLTGANIFEILGRDAKSVAGVNVNQESALGLPAIFRGVSLVSGDCAKLPVFVYRKMRDGNRQKDLTHPASPILRKKANPFVRARTMLQTLVGDAMLHRGGYARIIRGGDGRPMWLDRLHPEHTYPVVANGELFYQTILEGQNASLRAENVFHIKGLGGDGLDGYSVLDKLRDMIGGGLATQRHAEVFFNNAAQPRVVISFPGYLQDQEAIERFRASWGNVHGGVTNAHKPAILEGGAQITPFQMSNEDSQFIETQKFSVRMLAAVLGVPPHKVGDDTRTSYASLEQENQSYLDEALDPWLREIETEANEKLLTEQENLGETRFVEFVRAAF